MSILHTLIWRRCSLLRIAEEVRYRSELIGRPVYLLVGPQTVEIADTGTALSPERYECSIGQFSTKDTLEQIMKRALKAMAEEVA